MKNRVQDIGIATNRPAMVNRPEGTQTVYLEFRGTRDARNITDRDTRLAHRHALFARAAELRRQLADVAPPQHEIWRSEFLDIIEQHKGRNCSSARTRSRCCSGSVVSGDRAIPGRTRFISPRIMWPAPRRRVSGVDVVRPVPCPV